VAAPGFADLQVIGVTTFIIRQRYGNTTLSNC